MKGPMADLATEVNAALAQHDALGEYPLEAVNDSGVITLTGKVPSDELRETAEEVAASVEGVVKVVNDLEIGEPEAGRRVIPNPPDPKQPSSLT